MPNIQPRSGEKHRLFGGQYSKQHNFSDPKWKADDKITQYECIESIYEKSHQLTQEKQKSQFKARLDVYNKLAKDVNRQSKKLKDLQRGEVQRIKNTFQTDKPRQLIYSRMPTEKIIEDVSSKLFRKRKTLDRLRFEQKSFCKMYETKLKALATLQDRVKYGDEVEIDEEVLAKKLQLLLSNSKIQVKTYECLNRDCKKLINTLGADTMYYATVLDSLEDDVKEQIEILGGIMDFGVPELINKDKYKHELTSLETQNQMEANQQIALLSSYKQKLIENEEQLLNVVRRDDDFKVIPNRYNRQTPSMLAVAGKMEAADRDMKKLCDVSACAKPGDTFAAFKSVLSKSDSIKVKMNCLEEKLCAAKERLAEARQAESAVVFSVEKDDVERMDRITELEKLIENETNETRLSEERLKACIQRVFLVQHSLQHFADLMKNVGTEDAYMVKIPYPNALLKLPVLDLHFGMSEELSEPPVTIEENVDKLIEIVMNHTKKLAETYNKIESDPETAKKCKESYHKLVLNELKVEEFGTGEKIVDTYIEDEYDPDVKQRSEMKADAEKFAEKCKKEADE